MIQREQVEERYSRCPILAQKDPEQALPRGCLDAATCLISGAGEGIRTLDPNLGKTAAVWRRLSLCLEVPDDLHPGGRFAQFRQVTRRSVRAVRAMISSRSSCSKTAYRCAILMPDHRAIWQSARRLPPRLRNCTAKW